MRGKRARSKTRRRSVILGGVLALVSLSILLSATRLYAASERSGRIEQLSDTARFVAAALQVGMDDIRRESLAIAGVVAASNSVTPAEFTAFVDTSLAAPEVLARGVATRGDHGDGPAYVVTLWGAIPGSPDWDRTGIARPRVLVETFDRALESGRTQASGFVRLRDLDVFGILVVTPITSSAAADDAAFVLVNVDALRAARVSEQLHQIVDVEVDESTQNPEGAFFATNPISLGDRRWQVAVTPASGSPLSPDAPDQTRLFVATSFLVAALIGLGTGAIHSRRHDRNELAAAHALNEAQTRFIASVSHELRTPLAAVTGFMEILRENWEDLERDERDEFLALATEQSQEVAAIISDLLVLARAEVDALSLSIEPVPVLQPIRRALDSVPREHRQAISIDVPDVVVMADATRLAQVLRNLATNAIVHGAGTVSISSRLSPQTLTLCVNDEGPGVPEGLVGAIFEPFFSMATGTPALPSIGLGLFVARTLTEKMEGRLRYSHEDTTTFEVILPLAPTDDEQPADPGALTLAASHLHHDV